MKILFIHQNMPGQYKHLCRVFAEDPNNTVVFITKPKSIEISGVHKVEYKTRREPTSGIHHYIIGLERAIIQGQEVWRACRKLRDEEGFVPDIVVAHPGWGDTLYIKDVYPDTPLLSFFEFYYHSQGVDVNFDPSFPSGVDDDARVRTKNIVNLLNLECADWGISPTFWQHSLHPVEFQNRISVLHDGVDTDYCAPDENTTIELASGLHVGRKDEIVTYIARNFEPYRGFPTFMRAAEIILKERPNCKIVAVGADEVSYGRKLPKGQTWRHIMMDQVKLDKDRIFFTGNVSYSNLINLFRVSSAHIYLTYPFVLSWSMLEAMSTGVALVGSRTAPVEEVIRDGENGLLADFFSPEDVAAKVMQILDHKDKMQEMRNNARQTVVDKFAIKKLLPLHVDLVKDIAARKFPPPTHEKIINLYDKETLSYGKNCLQESKRKAAAG